MNAKDPSVSSLARISQALSPVPSLDFDASTDRDAHHMPDLSFREKPQVGGQHKVKK